MDPKSTSLSQAVDHGGNPGAEGGDMASSSFYLLGCLAGNLPSEFNSAFSQEEKPRGLGELTRTRVVVDFSVPLINEVHGWLRVSLPFETTVKHNHVL